MSTFNTDAFLEHIKLHRNESKIDIAKWAWNYRQPEIDDLAEMKKRYLGKMQEQQDQIAELKVQLNNMEQCYIGKKKQVEAVEHILGCAMIGPKQLFTYAGEIRKALDNPQYPLER